MEKFRQLLERKFRQVAIPGIIAVAILGLLAGSYMLFDRPFFVADPDERSHTLTQYVEATATAMGQDGMNAELNKIPEDLRLVTMYYSWHNDDMTYGGTGIITNILPPIQPDHGPIMMFVTANHIVRDLPLHQPDRLPIIYNPFGITNANQICCLEYPGKDLALCAAELPYSLINTRFAPYALVNFTPPTEEILNLNDDFLIYGFPISSSEFLKKPYISRRYYWPFATKASSPYFNQEGQIVSNGLVAKGMSGGPQIIGNKVVALNMKNWYIDKHNIGILGESIPEDFPNWHQTKLPELVEMFK